MQCYKYDSNQNCSYTKVKCSCGYKPEFIGCRYRPWQRRHCQGASGQPICIFEYCLDYFRYAQGGYGQIVGAQSQADSANAPCNTAGGKSANKPSNPYRQSKSTDESGFGFDIPCNRNQCVVIECKSNENSNNHAHIANLSTNAESVNLTECDDHHCDQCQLQHQTTQFSRTAGIPEGFINRIAQQHCCEATNSNESHHTGIEQSGISPLNGQAQGDNCEAASLGEHSEAIRLPQISKYQGDGQCDQSEQENCSLATGQMNSHAKVLAREKYLLGARQVLLPESQTEQPVCIPGAPKRVTLEFQTILTEKMKTAEAIWTS